MEGQNNTDCSFDPAGGLKGFHLPRIGGLSHAQKSRANLQAGTAWQWEWQHAL